MELWDLYDEHRAPLGRTHQRGLPLAPGEYHLAVIVVIVNSRGEVLLTRRSPEKAVCPGWWENTGGAVQAGETDAARWMPLAEWEQAAGMEGTLCPAQREPYKQELYRRIALYVRGRREF